MESRIAVLADKQAVVETVTRLFVATDNRDWRAVEACFSDVVSFDMSSMGAGPPARVSGFSAAAFASRTAAERALRLNSGP